MAEYDVTKLVKLAALKALAEKIKSDYATQADLTALSEQVEGIDIPKNVSELFNDSKYQTDEEVAAAIKELEDTLMGSGDGSIKKIVDAAINKFSTDVSENGTIDTFKELVDYVAKHGGEAAEMASAIETIDTKLEDIEEGAEKNVIATTSDEFTVTARNLAIAAIAMSKITGLSEALAAKAAAEHTHDIDEVTGLQDALDGKSPTTHTHDDASQTASGYMSADDKKKLDGIEIATDGDVSAMLAEVFSAS